MAGKKLRIGLPYRALAACWVLVLSATTAVAAEQRYDIDIPSLEADAALKILARQTEVQLLFPYDLVKTTQANPVAGRYTLQEALEVLLRNTGLSSSITKGGVITIVVTTATEQGGEQSMNGTRKLSLLGSVAAFLGVAIGPHAAWAEEREGDAALGKLEEIVVTAQKRTEDLEKVPISAQVITSQKLQEQNQNSLADLTQTVPAVHVSSYAKSNFIIIRGVGSGENPTFDQAAATFIDDIYYGRSRMTESAFMDLERIEVLKGPQSTFFGNNAIAGALNMVTKKPGETFEADTRALYGMYGQYAVEGGIGGPITPKLGVRLAAEADGGSGWMDNVVTNGDAPKTRNLGGRLTFVFKPTDDLDATLKLEGGNHHLDGSDYTIPAQYNACPRPGLDPSFNGFGLCSAILASASFPRGVNNRQFSGVPGEGNRLKDHSEVLTLNYRKWDQNFTSVSGYYHYDFSTNIAGPIETIGIPVNWSESYHQLSQEFRVASPVGQTLEYLAGLYYQSDSLDYDQRNHFQNYNFLFPFPDEAPYLPAAYDQGIKQNEHIYSAFGSLTWHVTDKLQVSPGIRATWVEKSMIAHLGFGTSSQIFGGVVLAPLNIQQEMASLVGFDVGSSSELKKDGNAVMPSVRFQYELNPRTMAYFRYDRGYLSGGFSGADTFHFNDIDVFGPEHVNAYEVGVKGRFLDDRLLVNVDVFRSNYDGLQTNGIRFITLNGQTGGTTHVLNAASSVSQGLEWEVQAVVTDDFRVSGNFTFLDSHFTSFPNAPPDNFQGYCIAAGSPLPAACAATYGSSVPLVKDLTGARTAYAPHFSGSMSFSYRAHLPGGFQLTTEVSPYYSSSYSILAGDPYSHVGAHARVDARISLATPDSHWAFDLIGKNLLDRDIITYQDTYAAQKEQPLNIAGQVRYKW